MSVFLAILFTVTPQEVSINQPVKVTLEIDQPIDVKKASGALTASGDFLISQEKEEVLGEKYRYEWTLEPLQAGTFPVSLYKLEPKSGPPVYIKAPVVTVQPFEPPQVAPLIQPIPLNPHLPPELSLTNQEELAKILQGQPARNRAILDAKAFPWMEFFFALFAIFSGIALYWYLEYRERNRPLPTPEELALSELETLQNERFETPAEFITRVTNTLREFIQLKYHVKAPYLTTHEFLQKTASHPQLAGEPRKNLGLFLSVADQVKFSQKPPTEADADTAFKFAESFISADPDRL